MYHFVVQFDFDLTDHVTFGNRGLQLRVHGHACGQLFQLAFRQGHGQVIRQAGFDLAGRAFPDRCLRQFSALLVEGLGFEETETVGHQLLGFSRARGFHGGAEHNSDQALAITNGRRHHAVARFVSVAGLQAIDGLVTPQQQVTVRLLDTVPEELFLRVDRVVSRVLVNDRTRQQRHVMRRRIVLRVWQPGRVHEVTVGHAQIADRLVHHVGKRIFTAGNVLGQRHAGVVARLDDDPVQKVADRYLRTHLDEHPRATGAPGILAHGNRVVFADLATTDFQGCDVRGHQLGEAGGRQTLVAVVLNQYVTAVGIHQNVGFGSQLWRRRHHFGCPGSRRDDQRYKQAQAFGKGGDVHPSLEMVNGNLPSRAKLF